VRLAVVPVIGGSAGYPQVGQRSISALGGITNGGLLEYQASYRDAASFCQPETFNDTNALSVVWYP
jgi:hypothetical protein